MGPGAKRPLMRDRNIRDLRALIRRRAGAPCTAPCLLLRPICPGRPLYLAGFSEILRNITVPCEFHHDWLGYGVPWWELLNETTVRRGYLRRDSRDDVGDLTLPAA